MQLAGSFKIFVASVNESGVFASTDNGASWYETDVGLPNRGIQSIAVDSSGNLYVLLEIYGGLIFHSTNDGNTWTTGPDSISDNVTSIVADKNYGIFASGSLGIYQSTDFGNTWITKSSGPTGNNVLTVNSYGNIFAGGSGVYRSTDGGTTWVQTTSSFGVSSLAVNDSGYVFALSDTSGASIVYRTAATTTPPLAGSPSLVLPSNLSTTTSTTVSFSWSHVSLADLYELQIATDTGFTSIVFDSITGSTSMQMSLLSAVRYYWRVRSINVAGKSSFCPYWTFVTFVAPPTNPTISSGNMWITLYWDASTAEHLVRYKIYRGTTPAVTLLHDSCATTSIVDSGLTNGTTYYYKLTAVDSLYGESGFSNEVSSTPFNAPPVPASLSNVSLLSTGRDLTSSLTFSSSGSHDPDGTIDSTLWYVNYARVGSLPSLTYDFGPGTSRVTLVVVDNQNAIDSSVALVNRAAYVRALGGPVTSGLSMVGNNVSYCISTGDAVYRLDSNETTIYKLQVAGSSGSSCSIAYDSTVYISSSDNNLYAFSKNATSVWPALPLGGNTSATPTVDSTLQRIYIGVSNNNFLGVNRLTGAVLWNFFTGSPITNSAVISNDRKLFFPTTNGTVYGVDLEATDRPASPTWYLSLPDTLPTSPAVDDSGKFYVGTANGNLYAISMARGKSASELWGLHLGGQLVAAPVIDGQGILYIGSTDSNLYAVNLSSENIAWSFKASGSIRYTAALSDAGRIYLDDDAGSLYCLSDSGSVNWFFSDTTDNLGVRGPLLYSEGMIYAGAGPRSVIAFYDNDIGYKSRAFHVSTVSVAVWGTFQGNNQRTGTQIYRNVNSDTGSVIPTSFALYANYPNPFNPWTTIKYDIPKQSHVLLEIYDVLGRRVETLVDEIRPQGEFKAILRTEKLSSGVYFYRLQAGNFTQVKKMVLIK
ncbi:MAG TPA: PQQ-binding-like beta-propeller repeat protein [Candidatus Kryptonia bacterium]